MRAADFADRLGDERTAHDLADRLRHMPEGDAYQFILEMLQLNQHVGLDLANRSLRSRPLFRDLLVRGLKTANASTIRVWLERIAPRLGTREVIDVLRSQLASDPRAVEQAVYWLPATLVDGNARDVDLVRTFRDSLAGMKHPL